MYYIGYTSVIAGSEDGRIFEYIDWCYDAEEDEEEIAEYPLGYFFSDNSNDLDYVLMTVKEQLNWQLFGQYPTADVIDRSSIMIYFDDEKCCYQ